MLPPRLDTASRASAERLGASLARGDAAGFAGALEKISPLDRDAWVDLALGLGPPPDDSAALPPGGVPYLPCPVGAVLRALTLAEVGPGDVFVDLGSGVGRAAAVAALCTGAPSVGVEIQPALVAEARALAARLALKNLTFVEADAAALPPEARAGTVFFLYCPFSGERLAAALAGLEALARERPVRLACVDLPLPPTPWLELAAPPAGDLTVYRSRWPNAKEWL